MQSISFDRAASFYDATRGYSSGSAERIRDAMVAATGATLDTRFCELGVGTGRIALPFIEGGYHYVGIDLSRSMLTVLQAKARAAVRPPLLVEGDVSTMPFADGCFDVALAVHLLHLVSDWRATLLEVRRLLRRPGGRLLIAGDVGVEDEPEIGAFVSPPIRAQMVWREALRAQGLSGREGQPGIRPHDPAVRAVLEDLGAEVTVMDLTEYERLPLTARQVIQGYRERIFSSDWSRPEALHAAAVAYVERWLVEECPEPDTPYALTGHFRAVIATW